jgi:hypothetical protein
MVRSWFSDYPGLAPVLVDVNRFTKGIRVLDLARSIRQQYDPQAGIDQSHMFGRF